jgi:hypothetical protein
MIVLLEVEKISTSEFRRMIEEAQRREHAGLFQILGGAFDKPLSRIL